MSADSKAMIQDISERLDRLESRGLELRRGTVTDTSPLSVDLGGSGRSYDTVATLPGTLQDGDAVPVLMAGNNPPLVLGGSDSFQPGDIKWSRRPSSPGWLLCNGQSTSGYPDLAAVVGGNVPDLRDRVPVGAGGSYALGSTGGEATHNLASAEVPLDGVVVLDATETGPNTFAAVRVASSAQAHNNLQPYLALNAFIKT